MADGETDGAEPAGRPPLPRADRVWRHPAEAAMEARQIVTTARRRRRRRAGISILGVAGAAAVLWLSQSGPTEVTVSADLASVGPAGGALPSTTAVAALLGLDAAPANMILVRAPDSTETLGAALAVRDGYVITSGQAVGGADEVMVSFGATTAHGVVVGHDAATDIAVIRLDTTMPSAPAPDADADLAAGDVVTIALQNGAESTQTVVEPASATALKDGASIVGIVELDGRLGEIAPGSPAYDASGSLVGVATATADTAPAALVTIRIARAVADDIIADGAADHPWLGVTARTHAEEPLGSLITALTEDGPAASGGVEVGDIVTAIGQNPVDSMEAMVASLRSYEPGTTVAIEVDRDGESITCVVELDSVLDHAA
ncbi:MAG: PDZ domain-containing protein [Acidimicrobiales bacterium]|nr:PDZ domain-containing protein [Acidimicrobiales bacterium]